MCSTLAATILFVLICNMMEGKSIFAPEKAAEEFTPGNASHKDSDTRIAMVLLKNGEDNPIFPDADEPDNSDSLNVYRSKRVGGSLPNGGYGQQAKRENSKALYFS
uniref:Uncharacterized protein n=1 Tax=Romanomermis culicivorax TaxID=13658 RepID=A0A915HKP9_ROMCU